MSEQILCVTCDNASNNDKMMEALGDLLLGFITSNHTRCFTHILNLVAKLLLKQFDVLNSLMSKQNQKRMTA
jgi:hypothetical protein